MDVGADPAPWLADADVVLVIDSLAPWMPDAHPLAGRRPGDPARPEPAVQPVPGAQLPVERVDRHRDRARASWRCWTRCERSASPRDADRTPAQPHRRPQRRPPRCASTPSRRSATAPMTKPFVSRCIGEALRDRRPTGRSRWSPSSAPRTTSSGSPSTTRGGRSRTRAGSAGVCRARWACKLADPDRLVVATMGDGSYLFANPVAAHHVGEAHGIAMLTVILNNAGLRRRAAVGHRAVPHRLRRQGRRGAAHRPRAQPRLPPRRRVVPGVGRDASPRRPSCPAALRRALSRRRRRPPSRARRPHLTVDDIVTDHVEEGHHDARPILITGAGERVRARRRRAARRARPHRHRRRAGRAAARRARGRAPRADGRRARRHQPRPRRVARPVATSTSSIGNAGLGPDRPAQRDPDRARATRVRGQRVRHARRRPARRPGDEAQAIGSDPARVVDRRRARRRRVRARTR